jgi:hypothetical protein
MIYKLRKRHLLFWQLIAALLPLLVIVAYCTTPPEAISKDLSCKENFPLLVSSREDSTFRINLRQSETRTKMQVEFVSSSFSSKAPMLIYISFENNPAAWLYLGKFLPGERNAFVFDIHDKIFPVAIKIIDILNKAEIKLIKFE